MAHLIREIPEYEHVSVGLQRMVADVWQISIVDENDIDPLREKLKGQTIHITEWLGAPTNQVPPAFDINAFTF